MSDEEPEGTADEVDLSPLSERGKVKQAPLLVLGGALLALVVTTVTFRGINERRRGAATRGQISGLPHASASARKATPSAASSAPAASASASARAASSAEPPGN